MIIRLYAVFGALFLIIMGFVWLGNNGIIEHNVIQGVLSLIFGVFGLLYVCLDIIKSGRKRSGRKERVVQNADKNKEIAKTTKV